MAKKDEVRSKIYIPSSLRAYDHDFCAQLDGQPDIFPQIRFETFMFGSMAPMILSGEAPHAVMLWLLNGDNWANAKADLDNAGALKQDLDRAGPNVDKLSLLARFIELRQDQRTRKPIANLKDALSIVKAQASTTEMIASAMGKTTKVDQLFYLDGHSHLAAQQFENHGVKTTNLTAAFLMIEELRSKEIINSKLPNMLCGIDFGNLPLIQRIFDVLDQELKLDIGIFRKWREAINGGTSSIPHHELIYGNVRGKRVILIDDMLSSGDTLGSIVKNLLKMGAAEVVVCATHAVYAGRSYYKNIQELLRNPKVKVVMVTNSIPLRRPIIMPGVTDSKSEPYVGVPGSDDFKSVQRLDINAFLSTALKTIMDTGTYEETRTKLGIHVVEQKEPFEVFHEITDKKYPKSEEVAIYREYGVLEFFEEFPELKKQYLLSLEK